MPPMEPDVVQRVLDLNATFYQVNAVAFADTRRRPQPGVCAVVEAIEPSASILDVGCGHGLVAGQLHRQGHSGGYTGIDSSPQLLALAAQSVPTQGFAFHRADLAAADWPQRLSQTYQVILAFAVLHHLPGEPMRQRVASSLAKLLTEDGRIEVSVWNFLELPRLRQRIVPWKRLGLADDQVDPDDYLLDWRHAGRGLRYVHTFTPASLGQLAAHAGLMASDGRFSDGENGRLGLYQRWSLAA